MKDQVPATSVHREPPLSLPHYRYRRATLRHDVVFKMLRLHPEI